MRALVTGATGFVGAAVARVLLSEGWQVRALTRPGADRTNLLGLDIDIAEGDLTDAASLAPALAHCQALFHVAADYRLGVRDHAQLYRTNVEGTAHLLSAARGAGIERIVYTSSVATLGIPKDGTPGDEMTPVSVDDMIGHYKRSKFLAEELVRREAASGLPVVIVNPSTPVGPGDVKPTPTGKILVDAARGRMPAFVDTGLNIVHVDDCARGHLLAFQHGRLGERYVLGGQDMSLKSILGEVARLTGRAPPRVRLPHAAVMPIAWLSEGFAAATGTTASISIESVRMSRKLMFFSSAKAQRELGYRVRPPIEAFADALEWFASHGRLGDVQLPGRQQGGGVRIDP
jgi:dihydroflavonol-4-reductase